MTCVKIMFLLQSNTPWFRSVYLGVPLRVGLCVPILFVRILTKSISTAIPNAGSSAYQTAPLNAFHSSCLSISYLVID